MMNTVKKCIGYGEKEGTCNNQADTPWGPYWCEKCNQARMKNIVKRFGGIGKDLDTEAPDYRPKKESRQ